MSASSFYTQQTKHLHARYKLSANAVHLLKTFDNFKIGCIDEATFARLVRWSPSMRKAAIEIISKCAKEMQQDPKETNDCIALIHQCTEILEMAGESPFSANPPSPTTPLDPSSTFTPFTPYPPPPLLPPSSTVWQAS